jgi:hypothetical protein
MTAQVNWAANTVFAAGVQCVNPPASSVQFIYTCVTAGTSASSGAGPTGNGALIQDGSCVWAYTQQMPIYDPPGQNYGMPSQGQLVQIPFDARGNYYGGGTH